MTLWIVFALGCLPAAPVPRNCTERIAFLPDRDGDGIGERTEVFVGCEAPDGWVPASNGTEPGVTPEDTEDTGDSSPPTGDTSTPDTATQSDTGSGTGDTATDDTAATDTAATDTAATDTATTDTATVDTAAIGTADTGT